MDLNLLSKDTVMILLIILSFLVVILIIYLISQKLHGRFKRYDLDETEGHDFEYYCADLLRKRGFIDVSVTKGSGDYGIDILAEKDGVTYAIQCKAYASP